MTATAIPRLRAIAAAEQTGSARPALPRTQLRYFYEQRWIRWTAEPHAPSPTSRRKLGTRPYELTELGWQTAGVVRQ